MVRAKFLEQITGTGILAHLLIVGAWASYLASQWLSFLTGNNSSIYLTDMKIKSISISKVLKTTTVYSEISVKIDYNSLPYPQRMCSKSLGGCLKPRIVLDPIYTMFSPICICR